MSDIRFYWLSESGLKSLRICLYAVTMDGIDLPDKVIALYGCPRPEDNINVQCAALGLRHSFDRHVKIKRIPSFGEKVQDAVRMYGVDDHYELENVHPVEIGGLHGEVVPHSWVADIALEVLQKSDFRATFTHMGKRFEIAPRRDKDLAGDFVSIQTKANSKSVKIWSVERLLQYISDKTAKGFSILSGNEYIDFYR